MEEQPSVTDMDRLRHRETLIFFREHWVVDGKRTEGVWPRLPLLPPPVSTPRLAAGLQAPILTRSWDIHARKAASRKPRSRS